MRKINLIIVHCSDSDNPKHDNIETIEEWHKLRGFAKVGYHYFINKGGTIQVGRDEGEIGAHCKGHNKSSIGICLSGKDKDKFTPEQFHALRILCEDICKRHKLKKIDIVGHCDLDKNGKTCPNFNIQSHTATWIWH